jgi:putative spermidine/putrescine transport system permease protein
MNGRARVGWPLRIMCAIVGLWLIAPTIVVIPLSFTGKQSFEFPPESWSLDYYVNFFTDPDWVAALLNSVRLAIVVTVVATVLGTAAAFAMARGKLRGSGAANGLLLMPLIVPQIIVALAIYIAFLQWGLVGTLRGFVLAHTALAIPFVVIPVSASIRALDRRLEHAAASLGAPPLTVLRSVTIPLMAPGVAAGAVFAFVTSFDEVVIALYLQSPDLRTLPVKMFTSVTSDTDPTIAAASAVILSVTTLLILLPAMLTNKKPSR